MQLTRIGLKLGSFVLASWAILLCVTIQFGTPWYALSVGYFYAMLFTHPILAAAWAGLGSSSFCRRLVGAAVWLLGTFVFCTLCIFISEGSVDSNTEVVLGITILALWLFVLPLFMLLARQFGIKIRRATSEKLIVSQERNQFGIRHLLGLMSGLALVIGIGRAMLPLLKPHFPGDTVTVLVCFGVASVISQVPLGLSILLRRFAILSVLLAILFIALVTLVQYPILSALRVAQGEYSLVIATNVFSTILVAMLVGIIRWDGFVLMSDRRQNSREKCPGSVG